MANIFKSYMARQAGTSEVLLVTVAGSTQTVAVGINLSNLLGTQITASVYIERGGSNVDYHIVKDVPIPAASSLSVLDGKIILEAADKLYVKSSASTSLDAILSVLEIT
jgi:hypothetical protein